MAVFSPLVRRDQVSDAILSTCQRWLPTHLGRVERDIAAERGLPEADFKGALDDIASWAKRREFENWPEDTLPAFNVVTGATSEMIEDEDGYWMRWAAACRIICAGPDRDQTDDLCSFYGAALADTLASHPGLEGFAENVLIADLTFDDGPVEEERTLGAALVTVIVTVSSALGTEPFPYPDPQPDPRDTYPDVPLVDTVEADLDRDE